MPDGDPGGGGGSLCRGGRAGGDGGDDLLVCGLRGKGGFGEGSPHAGQVLWGETQMRIASPVACAGWTDCPALSLGVLGCLGG